MRPDPECSRDYLIFALRYDPADTPLMWLCWQKEVRHEEAIDTSTPQT